MPLFDQIFLKKDSPALLYAPVVRLVTLWFGTNDAALSSSPTHQNVPLPEFTANLRTMMDNLTSPSSPYAVAHTQGFNVVLITPPPMYPPGMDADSRGNRSVEVTKKYAEAVLSIAKEYQGKERGSSTWKVGSIDLFNAVLEDAGGDGPGLTPYFT